MSLNILFLCSKNGLWNIATKLQIVTKSRLHCSSKLCIEETSFTKFYVLFRQVSLEAFEDQVSGQNNVVCLTKGTLAKTLNLHENKFYQTMDETLIPFVPKYKGTINVDSIEDEKSNNLYSKDTILEENESYHNSQEYLLL